VPLGIILLKFGPKESSGLSQASIFGATLGALVLNVRNKHPCTIKVNLALDTRMASIPTKDDKMTSDNDTQYYTRPLIDYDMALFLSPMEMAGAVLGLMIQKILPNWLYMSIAGVVLGLTSIETYKKFVSEAGFSVGIRPQLDCSLVGLTRPLSSRLHRSLLHNSFRLETRRGKPRKTWWKH
jgi:hypothetical protein